VNLGTTEWKLNRLLQRFDFSSVQGVLEGARAQSLLRRKPVEAAALFGENYVAPRMPAYAAHAAYAATASALSAAKLEAAIGEATTRQAEAMTAPQPVGTPDGVVATEPGLVEDANPDLELIERKLG
jgi:hypothetical protein